MIAKSSKFVKKVNFVLRKTIQFLMILTILSDPILVHPWQISFFSTFFVKNHKIQNSSTPYVFIKTFGELLDS